MARNVIHNEVMQRIATLETKTDHIIKQQKATNTMVEKIYNFLFEKNGGGDSMAYKVNRNEEEIQSIKEQLALNDHRRFDKKMVVLSGFLSLLSGFFAALLILLISRYFFN